MKKRKGGGANSCTYSGGKKSTQWASRKKSVRHKQVTVSLRRREVVKTPLKCAAVGGNKKEGTSKQVKEGNIRTPSGEKHAETL